MIDKKIPLIPRNMAPEIDETGLDALIIDVEKMLNIHLTNYKHDYIKRRMLSRMNSTKQKNFVEYHRYLKLHPEEEDKLRNALTINVTKFYRDPEVFNLIKNDIFPLILKERKSIKIWSAGCSSGEEPYTYAIMLYNLGRAGSGFTNTIIASDIDETILQKAREGIYEKTALVNLSEADIIKHFDKLENGKYSVRSHIKQMVQFRSNDLMKGIPPGKGFDMVSCRNVTIYFNEQQKKDLVKLMHQSLVKDGFYIMGMSEYMSKDVDYLFTPYKPMLKAFRRREVTER